MTELTQTQTQLRELGYPSIGIQCRDGLKIFGRVTKFTKYKIYLEDKNGDIIDVPRRIIRRAFLLIDGGMSDDGAAEIFRTDQSTSWQRPKAEE